MKLINKEDVLSKNIMSKLIKVLEREIEKIPDVQDIDAVEVVRCKYCKFGKVVGKREPKYKCENINIGGLQWVRSDFYCGSGCKK
jgi:hypothetical protein